MGSLTPTLSPAERGRGSAKRGCGAEIAGHLTAMLAAVQDHESSTAYLRLAWRWHNELLSSVRGLSRWRDRLRLLREVVLPTP